MKPRFLIATGLLALALFFAYLTPKALASSSGPNGPSTCVDDSTVGTTTWTSPGNATANDASYAQAITNSSISHYLKCTSFGFSIPAGATINGILVEIERLDFSSGSFPPVDSTVKLVSSAGSFVGNNKADTTTHWPTSEAFASYGSSSDLWGSTWAPSDINSSSFGVGISASAPSPNTTIAEAEVDYMRITITYTPAAAGAAPVQQAREISIF